VADVSILDPSVSAAPKGYTVKGAQEIVVRTVTASFDGTAAAGSFVPVVQLIDPSGFVTGTYTLGQTLSVGATADVTWFPSIGSPPTLTASHNTNLVLTGAGMWPSLTSGSSFPNRVESATNRQNVYFVDFLQSVQSFAQATTAMPSNWDLGTVTATFYWAVNGTTAGNVIWQLQGRCYGNGNTIDQAFGTAQTVTSAATGTANQVIISSATAAITFAGSPAASQLVQFRVARNGNSDTLAATARLLLVLVTYGTV
jgi:hypothetical protein